MSSLGLMEILLILLTGGDGTNDIVSFLPVQSYFKSRDIDINVTKAMELAGKEPVDGRAQIAQLLAMRYLAEESAQFKNAPNLERHRQLLGQIAAGKVAQDPQGFAKDYAAHVLARLDGTKPAPDTVVSLRDEPFRWFPADASLLAVLDTRSSRDNAGVKGDRAAMLKMIPPDMLKSIFGVVEKIGNVRVDRVAFALVETPQQPEKSQIHVRLTGKANPGRLVEALKELNQQIKTSKGPKGESITLLIKPNRPPGLMLVGDHDMVIAGYMGNNTDHEELLTKVLDIREGKAKHAADGLLRAELAKIPVKAIGLVVGHVPTSTFQGAPFPLPVTIAGHLLRVQDAVELHLVGTMAKDEEAKQLVTQVSQFRAKALESLKAAPNGAAGDPLANQRVSLTKLLEGMQFEANGNRVQIRMLLPEGILGAASLLLGSR